MNLSPTDVIWDVVHDESNYPPPPPSPHTHTHTPTQVIKVSGKHLVSLLNKSINATVNIFIFHLFLFIHFNRFRLSIVLVKNKHISQLHSISLLHFFYFFFLIILLNLCF